MNTKVLKSYELGGQSKSFFEDLGKMGGGVWYMHRRDAMHCVSTTTAGFNLQTELC